jgi:hypothetical protein
VKGIHKFSAGVAQAFAQVVLPRNEPYGEELATVLMNRILGLQAPTSINRSLTEEEFLISVINQHSSEINNSFESLLDTEVYVRRFPYKNARVTKVRYLRHAIETHFSNVYILKQRLKTFLKVLEDLYAKDSHRKKVRKITQPLFQSNSKAFEGIVAVRSSHVHKESYRDKELSRLETMELLLLGGKSDQPWMQYLENYFESQYKRIREKKAKEIRAINKTIEDILDDYFEEIYPILFDQEGHIILPTSSKP